MAARPFYTGSIFLQITRCLFCPSFSSDFRSLTRSEWSNGYSMAARPCYSCIIFIFLLTTRCLSCPSVPFRFQVIDKKKFHLPIILPILAVWPFNVYEWIKEILCSYLCSENSLLDSIWQPGHYETLWLNLLFPQTLLQCDKQLS